MSKSNEYGYIPESPTQAQGSNTGIFEVNDVTDLLLAGQWTLQDFDGKLEYIARREYTGTTTHFNFGSISESSYSTHVLVVENAHTVNDGQEIWLRFSTDNLSTAITTGYKWTQNFGDSGPNHSSGRSQNSSRITLASAVGNDAYECANGVIWLYNLGDSALQSHCTFEFSVRDNSARNRYHFGGGALNNNNTINGLQVIPGSGNFNNGSATLYGLARA